MSAVTLVSGGLDSTVMAVLASKEHVAHFPLFIDYGQLGRDRELAACRANFRRHNLPTPHVASLPGFGTLLSSGLTDPRKDVYADAFLPCRNLFFLTVAAGYAFQCGVQTICVGLLNEAFSIFPDQTRAFLDEVEVVLSRSLSKSIRIRAPLMGFSKADVVEAAKELGVTDTYSCHAGTEMPCGICVACREFRGLEM